MNNLRSILVMLCIFFTTSVAMEREEVGATVYQDSLLAVLYQKDSTSNSPYWLSYGEEGNIVDSLPLSVPDYFTPQRLYVENGLSVLHVTCERAKPSPTANIAIIIDSTLSKGATIDLPYGEVTELIPSDYGIISVLRYSHVIASSRYYGSNSISEYKVQLSTSSNMTVWNSYLNFGRNKPVIGMSNGHMLIARAYKNATPLFTQYSIPDAREDWTRSLDIGQTYAIRDIITTTDGKWLATGAFKITTPIRYTGTEELGVLTIDTLGEKLKIRTFDSPQGNMNAGASAKLFRDGTIAIVGTLGFANNPDGIKGSAGLYNIPEYLATPSISSFGSNAESADNILLLGNDLRWVHMVNSGWQLFNHEFNFRSSLKDRDPIISPTRPLSRVSSHQQAQFVVNKQLRISLPEDQLHGTVKIYSASGRLLQTVHVANNATRIHLNSLGTGLYISHLSYNGKVDRMKFVLR